MKFIAVHVIFCDFLTFLLSLGVALVAGATGTVGSGIIDALILDGIYVIF